MATKQKKKEAKEPWLHRYRYWVVFAFAFMLYANTIPNFYCMDDELVTTTDPNYPHRLTAKGISAIPQIFKEPYYKDDQGYAYDYRPIVLVTFAIEHSLFGDNSHMSHFINVLLYALLCVLLLRVLSELLKDYNPLIAFIATLVYAAHPIHTEVVASIKNRDEILALLLAILSLHVWLTVKPQKWAVLFSLPFLIAAIYTKSTILGVGIIIPAVYQIARPKSAITPLLIYFGVSLLSYIPISTIPSVSLVLMGIALATAGAGMFFWLISVSLNGWQGFVIFNNLFIRLPAQAEEKQKSFLLNGNWSLLTALFLILFSTILYVCNVRYYLIPILFLSLLPFVSSKYRDALHFLFSVVVFIICILTGNSYLLDVLFPLYIIAYSDKTSLQYTLCIWLITLAITLWLSLTFPATLIVVAILLWQKDKLNNSLYLRFFLYATLLVYFVFTAINTWKTETEVRIVDFAYEFLIPGTIFILITPYVRKYAWSILTITLILLTAVSYNYISVRYDRTPVAAKLKTVDSEVPKVIVESSLDRPISLVESVTNAHSPLIFKLGTAAQVLKKYARLVVIPWPMSYYYGYKVIEQQSILNHGNWLALLLYLCGIGIAIGTLRYSRVVSMSLFVLMFGIAIYLNLYLPAPGMMADRFLFLPSLGFALLLSYFSLRLFNINSDNNTLPLRIGILPRPFVYVITAFLFGYSVMTIIRNTHWKNSVTLFAADIDHLQESAQANNLYAIHLMKASVAEPDIQKQRDMQTAAEKHFKQALSIYPAFFNAQYDLGRVQSILSKNAEAEQSFASAAKLSPDFTLAWLGAAEMAMKQAQYARAIVYFSSVAEPQRKEDPSYFLSYSYAYYQLQKYDSSVVINLEALRYFPAVPDFYFAIGQTYLKLNQTDSTILYYEKALALNPSNTQLQQTIQQLKGNKK